MTYGDKSKRIRVNRDEYCDNCSNRLKIVENETERIRACDNCGFCQITDKIDAE